MLTRLKVTEMLAEYRGFLLFLILLGTFRGAIADWNPVPTGSMKPTIIEGDVIWVNKMAYDLNFPFTQYPLFRMSDPERGDIVVFKSKNADKRLVKRLIGIPGDEVAMLDNQLVINGKAADYEILTERENWRDFSEEIAGFTHSVRFSNVPNSTLSTFQSLTIPQGFYLMLGGNRDNSADSRVYGLVPRSEFVGRVSHVLGSFNPEEFYLPRTGRFISPLI